MRKCKCGERPIVIRPDRYSTITGTYMIKCQKCGRYVETYDVSRLEKMWNEYISNPIN